MWRDSIAVVGKQHFRCGQARLNGDDRDNVNRTMDLGRADANASRIQHRVGTTVDDGCSPHKICRVGAPVALCAAAAGVRENSRPGTAFLDIWRRKY
jgi:hypothetical protein